MVTGSITIKLEDYRAAVNIEDDRISLRSQETCRFVPGGCDTDAGSHFWSPGDEQECNGKTYIALFDGEAEFYQTKNLITGFHEEYVVVSSAAQAFALKLVRNSTACRERSIQTEHPMIQVVETVNNHFYFQKRAVEPPNTDWLAFSGSNYCSRNITQNY